MRNKTCSRAAAVGKQEVFGLDGYVVTTSSSPEDMIQLVLEYITSLFTSNHFTITLFGRRKQARTYIFSNLKDVTLH